jgi:hypothetical protein
MKYQALGIIVMENKLIQTETVTFLEENMTGNSQ